VGVGFINRNLSLSKLLEYASPLRDLRDYGGANTKVKTVKKHKKSAKLRNKAMLVLGKDTLMEKYLDHMEKKSLAWNFYGRWTS
jgi:hypothetical protein